MLEITDQIQNQLRHTETPIISCLRGNASTTTKKSLPGTNTQAKTQLRWHIRFKKFSSSIYKVIVLCRRNNVYYAQYILRSLSIFLDDLHHAAHQHINEQKFEFLSHDLGSSTTSTIIGNKKIKLEQEMIFLNLNKLFLARLYVCHGL